MIRFGVRTAYAALLTLVVILLTYCGGAPTSVDSARVADQLLSDDSDILPARGLIPDSLLALVPLPYDPARDGPPLANTRLSATTASTLNALFPSRNHSLRELIQEMAEISSARAGYNQKPLTLSDQPAPGAGEEFGWFLPFGHGIYSSDLVDIHFDIPSVNKPDPVIFSPTHFPGDYACLEATSIHFRNSASGPTQHHYGFYNWCASPPRWYITEDMEASLWEANYTLPTGDGRDLVYTMVRESSPGCWQGLLYNFFARRWEQKAFKCGSSAFSTGWTMWESERLMSGNYCPIIDPSIDTAGMVIQGFDGVWVPFTEIVSPQHTIGPLWFLLGIRKLATRLELSEQWLGQPNTFLVPTGGI